MRRQRVAPVSAVPQGSAPTGKRYRSRYGLAFAAVSATVGMLIVYAQNTIVDEMHRHRVRNEASHDCQSHEALRVVLHAMYFPRDPDVPYQDWEDQTLAGYDARYKACAKHLSGEDSPIKLFGPDPDRRPPP